MTNIGTFRSANNTDILSELIGTVRTINFSGKLSIQRDTGSSHPNAPTHRVSLVPDDAAKIEVGAAWTQRIKRGPREGEEFLSVTIDDPAWENSFSFSIFQEDETTWIATWRRRQSAA
tara:strand:+ start:2640 stop:2993 length:354 start_codon:yes stop_codon:yes gene_type:complete